jgi:hypothetical protein
VSPPRPHFRLLLPRWAALTLAFVAVVTSFLAITIARPRRAAAFVRARTEKGFSPLYWRDPRQVLEVARPAAETGITAEELRAASAAATGAWNHDAIACTSVNLTLAPEMSDDQITKFDGHNRISMRTGMWCRDPAHPTPRTCHVADAVALTTLFTRFHVGYPDDGRILEADIEVNAVDWQWAMMPDPVPSGNEYANDFDLTGALTHETGHFIGLDHTCSAAGPTALIDDQGRPVPECGLEPSDELAQIMSSTMYPRMNQSDVSWRTLSDDERMAACTMYPLTALPLDEWGGTGGCVIAAGPPLRGGRAAILSLAGWLPLLFATVLARARRRRRERFR